MRPIMREFINNINLTAYEIVNGVVSSYWLDVGCLLLVD